MSIRRQAALSILARTGMHRWNFAPPLYRVLWRLKLDIPPPHFLSFKMAAMLSGGGFSLLWLSIVALFQHHAGSIGAQALAAPVIGALFGLAMAIYYAYGKRKYHLPAWRALPSAPPR